MKPPISFKWHSESYSTLHGHRPPKALFMQGSLTQYLRQQGGVTVTKRQQSWARPRIDEQQLIAAGQSQQFALIREVSLQVDGVPWVFARTVLPADTLNGSNRFLRHWDSRPLGEFLFKHKGCTRGDFQFTLISGNHKSIPHDLKREGVLWGRRSLFFLNRKPLCVAEFYLPAFVEHLNRS